MMFQQVIILILSIKTTLLYFDVILWYLVFKYKISILDSGDKSVQCGRKSDAFKIWFMLKVRGEDYISRVVDNAFDMANKMETLIKRRDGFRMVLEQSCTNVCFVYIPPSLRNMPEGEEWMKRLDKVCISLLQLELRFIVI